MCGTWDSQMRAGPATNWEDMTGALSDLHLDLHSTTQRADTQMLSEANVDNRIPGEPIAMQRERRAPWVAPASR